MSNITTKNLKSLKKLDKEQLLITELLHLTWYCGLEIEDYTIGNFIKYHFNEWFLENGKNINMATKKELKHLCQVAWWDANVNLHFYKSVTTWKEQNYYCKTFFNRYLGCIKSI